MAHEIVLPGAEFARQHPAFRVPDGRGRDGTEEQQVRHVQAAGSPGEGERRHRDDRPDDGGDPESPARPLARAHDRGHRGGGPGGRR